MPEITPMTCAEAFRRLHDYLDRELSLDEIAGVEAHLALCEVCAKEFHFEASVIRDVRLKLNSVRTPAELIGRLGDALDKASGES